MNKRTNIVMCLSAQEKEDLYKKYLKKAFKSKTKLGHQFGVSLRTVNRVLDEFDKNNLPEYDYTLTKNQITLFLGEDSRSVDNTYPKFKQFRKQLYESDFSLGSLHEVWELLNVKSFIEKFSEGNITVDHEKGKVWYGTFEIKNSLSDHMMGMLSRGESDIKPFVKFADKLMSNPKQDIVEELYGFMQHSKIDIDDEGYIIAYKGVKDNYKDVWTNSISNKVGCKPVMPRSEVVHDPESPCGAGLHAGSFNYATGWSRGHVMKVRIHPADVCSVPWACDSQKMRTCGYEVIGEVK